MVTNDLSKFIILFRHLCSLSGFRDIFEFFSFNRQNEILVFGDVSKRDVNDYITNFGDSIVTRNIVYMNINN